MNRNFYLVVVARFLFMLGVQSQAVLMGWQMYDLTRNPLDLGLIGLAEAIPALCLALPAGMWIDRLNPFRFYQLTLLVSFISMLISWSANSPEFLYLAAGVTGLARAFTGPSMNSFIPRLVPRSELKRTSAYTTTAFKMATVIGPAVSGILLGVSGYTLPYLIAVSSLAAGSVCLLLVRYTHVPGAQRELAKSEARFGTPQLGSVTAELLSGVRFVWNHPLLLSALALDMFAVLFGGALAILPVYAAEILHVGPTGLGWLRASPALGAIVMSLYLIKNPITQNAGKILLVSVFGYGLCMLAFGVSTVFWISMVVLALSGAFDSVSMLVRGAIVQLCSPDEMRGRIASVNSIFIGSSNELGAFESGVAANYMGTVPSVVFGGVMTLVTVIAVAVKGRSLRALDLSKIE